MAENYITRTEADGTIHISDDVIAAIVKMAVKEVEGVASMAATAGPAMSELLGKKSAAKGIRLQFDEEAVTVDVVIMVKYGSNIMGVAKGVQENVLNALQSTAGLDKITVNVHVSGVEFEK